MSYASKDTDGQLDPHSVDETLALTLIYLCLRTIYKYTGSRDSPNILYEN